MAQFKQAGFRGINTDRVLSTETHKNFWTGQGHTVLTTVKYDVMDWRGAPLEEKLYGEAAVEFLAAIGIPLEEGSYAVG